MKVIVLSMQMLCNLCKLEMIDALSLSLLDLEVKVKVKEGII